MKRSDFYNKVRKDQLTASSKSLDMPIDNSHRDSAIPSTLQTSVLQFSSVYCITTKEWRSAIWRNGEIWWSMSIFIMKLPNASLKPIHSITNFLKLLSTTTEMEISNLEKLGNLIELIWIFIVMKLRIICMTQNYSSDNKLLKDPIYKNT